ncbi:cyclopropane-fatty-acyl-phospholipid synthase family protein [Gordonia sp. ABSL1-1]|uniref:SAM-dependent methyltransferase n=1 Tax=Gordonia sp. ABSL1-1 TaxID=3053923 RepID=UPI002573539B|nr:cyclopropane-fatty-acyl-phospholipid synthase family protein [Gordonia sp. ABSL1-1]MDL9935411.1 cyclopropane-fatty-acyl-phospholipid synthase family protein [Gordonia sp. ABSL1-1]
MNDSTVSCSPDPTRWPDVAAAPAGRLSGIRARAAMWLFRRAVGKLDIRVEYPHGADAGPATGRIQPRMIIRRPDQFARRVGSTGLIGFGESFMAGDWTTDDLVGVLTPFAEQASTLIPPALQHLRRLVLPSRPAAEANTQANSRRHIAAHYDLSDELFATFLDETMSYSSGLFDGPPLAAAWPDLVAAQHRKIDRLLDLAGVGPGTRLLEIGTGWGELCLRAGARGAMVTSVTLSAHQRDLARRRVAEAGLSDRVSIELLDYREVTGTYDAVVSVEMIEAVGAQYWPAYFEQLDHVLRPHGRVAIQAITMPHDRMSVSHNTYTWVQKYIFPGGQLPSVDALAETAARHSHLRLTSSMAFGTHYAQTLKLWRERFDAHHDDVRRLGFDRTFERMWRFYLAYSEAGFRAGYLDVHQLVFTRPTEVTR